MSAMISARSTGIHSVPGASALRIRRRMLFALRRRRIVRLSLRIPPMAFLILLPLLTVLVRFFAGRDLGVWGPHGSGLLVVAVSVAFGVLGRFRTLSFFLSRAGPLACAPFRSWDLGSSQGLGAQLYVYILDAGTFVGNLLDDGGSYRAKGF